MATAPALTPPVMESRSTWSPQSKHVQRALKFIRNRGGEIPTEDLVAWDFTHGRHLFTWDDPKAAAEWRMQEARYFLSSFRATFNGYRVRAFISVGKNPEAGIERRGYRAVEEIADNPHMRQMVIDSLTARMANLASELKMWELSRKEQEKLFVRLREAMGG
jgi:hypothetical protein